MTIGVAVFAGAALASAFHPAIAASDLMGRVRYSGLPVPGATIIATQGDRTRQTISGDDGTFRFAALEDGAWLLRIEMRGFATVTGDVHLPYTGAPLAYDLTMRTYAEIVRPAEPGTAIPAAPAMPSISVPIATDTDVDFINGSVSNGAATPFAQNPAFGNNRQQGRGRYTGGLSLALGNSRWNARPYSFGGSGAAPVHGDVQAGLTIVGPLVIPGLIRNGPQMVATYQRSVLHRATTQSAIVPTEAQRTAPPPDRVSPQATALLTYYPLPNTSTTRGANFQTAVVAATTQDTVQASFSQNVTTRSTVAGSVAFQRSASDTIGLFGFEDRSGQSSLDAAISWSKRVSARLSVRARYQFTRTASSVVPFFAGRINVSGDAGITGNNQAPANWGPPSLSFPDIAGLRDADAQRSVALKHGGGWTVTIRRGRHNLTAGADARWDGYDITSQADPRGTLGFTGDVTGDPFTDFLIGMPSTSSIGFSLRATRLRGLAYDAYVSDDWRFAGVTLTLGARYEYEPPFVNELIRPDRRGLQPRLAASWRPIPGSTLVVRTGYGVSRNAGLYQPLAQLLTQQPPFARTFSVQNTPAVPLTLANPFPASIPSAATFTVDPGLRAGYAQNWYVSAQRDVRGSLTLIASYLGTKGSNLMQATLPNTYPPGGSDPCPSCPGGFVHVTSKGSSMRNALQLTLRRRLHNGLTASAQYTLASATDDAATFSNAAVSPQSLSIAQDWRDPGAERGPSAFDQRHLMALHVQYTVKNWTIASQLSTGSGLPFTPISFTAIGGSGFLGVRPVLTGVSPEPVEPGSYANVAAYAAPAAGTWGDAGRHSIRGPAPFSLDANLTRVIPLRGRFTMEARLAATNVLNRVTFAAINTVITSPQFGLPTVANPMRRLQAGLRFRF